MNAIELLESQHREVEDLFAQYHQLEEGDEEGKRRVFLQLADALSSHMAVEEQTFYPAARRAAKAVQVPQLVRGHLVVRRLIAQLLGMDAGDPDFDARVEFLQGEVDHHVREQEDRLFPQVCRSMDAEQLARLGREMQGAIHARTHRPLHRRVPTGREGPALI